MICDSLKTVEQKKGKEKALTCGAAPDRKPPICGQTAGGQTRRTVGAAGSLLGWNTSLSQGISTDHLLRRLKRGTLGRNGTINLHDSVKLIKFADDTTLIGLISNNDESAYRREVDRLVSWCSGNNLELNAQKTVEMIVDFRKSTVPPPPPSVMDSPITSVESFRFLGTTITQDLKWEPTISSLIKKAQQRMYFLRQLRKAKLPAPMLVQFYTAIIESILTSSVTVWFAGATVRDKQRLQRIVRSAEEVIGRSLPSLQDLAVHCLVVISHYPIIPLSSPLHSTSLALTLNTSKTHHSTTSNASQVSPPFSNPHTIHRNPIFSRMML
uniref:Alkylated DNA repair protein AlkB homologue 8 N-terminal domain-containing protein n=1 Tax=Knipowitschia caucasica TaxID=637954 RepID=A0AAV2K1I5_KNICA